MDADAPGDEVDREPWGASTPDERAWVDALGALLAAREGPPAAWDAAAEPMAERRLLASADPAVPRTLLLQGWRELQGARLAREGALRLAAHGLLPLALARARWGASPAVASVSRPEAALDLARAPGVVAVLDAATPAAATPWWARLLASPELRVVARLPDLGPGAGEGTVLAVARAEPGPTGGDETFWVTDAPLPPASLVAALSAAGLAGEVMAQAGGLKLTALAGYLQRDDPRLARAPGRLSGVVGAAPRPPFA